MIGTGIATGLEVVLLVDWYDDVLLGLYDGCV